MEQKENDLFLNMVLNPSYSLGDFSLLGFTADNTTVQDKDSYRNNKIVKEAYTNDAGNFDEAKFSKDYDVAINAYAAMGSQAYTSKMLAKSELIYDKDNIFVPIEQRAENKPNFIRQTIYNPTHIVKGLGGINYTSEPKQTNSELAQSSNVLLNPVAVENGAQPVWGDNPHDGFFDYLTDTLVLAAYDSDGQHEDILTGEMVDHQKGELKLNSDGEYYYERLDGRPIYGKDVLRKWNVLTEEGSWLNQYDFFDSDDMKKSAIGTIMKELALVGTMFIPGIGSYVAGLSAAVWSAGLLATLGKMATFNSNNPALSELEGWVESMTNRGNVSEYAKKNPWSLENMLVLIGDVGSQLKEQRFIAEKVPALFKGDLMYGSNKKATEALRDKKFQQLLQYEKNIAKDRLASGAAKPLIKNQDDLVKLAQTYQAAASTIANESLQNYLTGYNKLGALLSKGYMTMLTVGDTYGEAIAAGASESDATLLTLGYAIGEYQILRTGIGEWILPEYRAEKQLYKRIPQLLANDARKAAKEVTDKYSGAAIGNLPKKGKMEYVKKMLGLGQNLARDVYTQTGNKAKNALSSALVHGLGEGVEEVSEELLADFSKGAYDIVNWLRGNDVRLDAAGFHWGEEGRSWDFNNIRDRYGLSFVGGAIGGSLTSLGTNFYQNGGLPTDRESALQALVDIYRRDGNFDKIRKAVSKMNIANPHYSTWIHKSSNGNLDFKPGTEEDNQDRTAKIILNRQLDTLENIFKSHGSYLTNDQFLTKQIVDDLRFNMLHKSSTAIRFVERYNTLNVQIAKKVGDINTKLAVAADTNNNGKIEDYEARKARLKEEDKKQIEKYEEELKSLEDELKALVNGENSVEYIKDAMFELSPAISSIFLTGITLQSYTLAKYGKKYNELDPKIQQQILKDYNDFKALELKEQVPQASDIFTKLMQQATPVLTQQNEQYAKVTEAAQKITELLNKINYIPTKRADGSDISTLDQLEHVENALSTFTEGVSNILGLKELLAIYDQARKDLEKIKPTLSREQYLNEVKKIENKYKKDIDSTIGKYALDLVKPFQEQGFINQVTKQQLNQVFNYIQNLTLKALDLSNSETNLTAEDQLYIENLFAGNIPLKHAREILDNLNSSPMEINLNQFIQKLGINNINVFELIGNLDGSLQGIGLKKFNLTSKALQDIDIVMKTIRLYQAVLTASRVDDLHANNLWGYTSVVNELSAKANNPTNYAEINKEFADVVWEDLQALYVKLRWYKQIHELNKGNKIHANERIATKQHALIVKKLRYIISVYPPIKEWDRIQILEKALDNSSIAKSILDDDKDLSLNAQQQLELEQEVIQLGDAVNEVFNANADKLSDLLQPELFNNIWNEDTTIITEVAEEIEDKAFIWWLAGRMALKTSDFYSMAKEVIDPKSQIMFLPSQELAIFNNIATIINKSIFSQFVNILRTNMKQKWLSLTENDRKKLLKRMGMTNEDVNFFSQDKLKQYCFSFLYMPRYDHIMFTEGSPGTGKTDGVTSLTTAILNKFYPKVTENVHIIHCIDGKGDNKQASQGERLKQKINVKGSAFTTEDYFKKIAIGHIPFVPGSTIDESQYQIIEDGEVVSKLELSANAEVPSLIIIDEGTNLTLYELDLLNRFAAEHDIMILMMGDFDQNKVEGFHPLKLGDTKIHGMIETIRPYFMTSPKLGLSLRTGNDIKNINLTNFQEYMHSDFSQPCPLMYYKDDTGLYGDLITTNDQVEEEIEHMLETVGDDKIIWAYDKEGTALQKKYKDNDKIVFVHDTEIQGREGKYYIVESRPINNSYNPQSSLRSLYTGISRSKQASICIVANSDKGLFKPIKTEEKIDEDFKVDIPKYSNARKKRLDSIIKGVTVPEIKKGSKVTTKTTNPAGKSTAPLSNSRTFILPSQPPQQGTINQLNIDEITQKWGDKMQITDVPIKVGDDNITLAMSNITTLADNDIVTVPVITLRYHNLLTNTDVDVPIALVQIHNTIQPFFLENGIWNPFFGLSPEIDQSGAITDLGLNVDQNRAKNLYNSPILQEISTKLGELFGVTDTNFPVSAIDNIVLDQINTSFPEISQDVINTQLDTIDSEIEQLKKKPGWKPEQRSPIQYPVTTYTPALHEGESLIVINDVMSEGEYAKSITIASENQLELNPVRAINNAIRIGFRGYTFNTLELGAVVDDQGNIVYEGARSRARIDGVNGLRKIDKHLSKNASALAKRRAADTSVNGYLKRIAGVRSIIFNTPEKVDIIQQLRTYLGFDVEFVNFAIKCIPPITEGTRNDPNKQHIIDDSRYYKYDINKNEKVHYSNSNDTRSDEIMPHKLVALIGNKELGEVFEVPLFSLNSPLTVMNYKDPQQNLVFKDVHDFFEAELNKPNGTIHAAAIETVKKFKGVGIYKELIDLFELFNFTYSGLFRINNEKDSSNDPFANWTPAKDLINLGPMFSLDRGVYQYANGMQYSDMDGNMLDVENFISVENFSNQPQVQYVTPILTCIDGAHPETHLGHPVVLVSFDKNLTGDQRVVDYYLRQQKDSTLPPKVKLMEILPPSCSLEEYFDHIDRKLKKDSTEGRHIGNLFTPYRLLSKFFKDDAFMDFIESTVLPGVRDAIGDIINTLDKYDAVHDYGSIYNMLMKKGTYHGSNRETTLVTYLDNLLLSMAYNSSYANILASINNTQVEYTIDQDIINRMQLILDKEGFIIYHDTPLNPNTRGADMIGPFIITLQEDKWHIDGKPYKIHGKLDSYVFGGDMSQIISMAVGKIKLGTTKSGGFRMYTDDEYYEGGQRTPSAEELSSGVLIGKVNTIKGVDFSDLKVVSTREELDKQKEVILSRLRDANRIAFYVGDELKYSEVTDLGRPILNQTQFDSKDNVRFTVTSGDKVIDVEYDVNNNQIQYWEEKSSNNQIINITNIQSNVDLFLTILDSIPALEKKAGRIKNRFENLNQSDPEQYITELKVIPSRMLEDLKNSGNDTAINLAQTIEQIQNNEQREDEKCQTMIKIY